MSNFLSWENARDESADRFFRLWMAHISTIFVHDGLIFEKMTQQGDRVPICGASGAARAARPRTPRPPSHQHPPARAPVIHPASSPVAPRSHHVASDTIHGMPSCTFRARQTTSA